MPLRSDEIRDMSDGDIQARVTELEEERFRLKFRSATEPLENPLRLRTIRRDIARLKTILRERQLAAGTREAGGGGASATRPQGTRAGTRGRGQS
jgi:large subunit ribosomal protein L29